MSNVSLQLCPDPGSVHHVCRYVCSLELILKGLYSFYGAAILCDNDVTARAQARKS